MEIPQLGKKRSREGHKGYFFRYAKCANTSLQSLVAWEGQCDATGKKGLFTLHDVVRGGGEEERVFSSHKEPTIRYEHRPFHSFEKLHMVILLLLEKGGCSVGTPIRKRRDGRQFDWGNRTG